MLKLFKRDKFYKIGDQYIKLSRIYQMSKLNVHTDRYNYTNEYMQGSINEKEFKIPICISHYKPEYQQEEIEKEPFFQEYTTLYKDFLKFNNLEEV